MAESSGPSPDLGPTVVATPGPPGATHAREDTEDGKRTASGAEADPDFSPPAQPGDIGKLGRYRVIRKLGQGGMGTVYLGHDTVLDRQVALKVMLVSLLAETVSRERFLREARATARVKCDHVVTIHDVGEEHGLPYIAMEYLLGYSLDQYLACRGELPPEHLPRVAREAARGLAAAHKLGLVHRDIKPANLWLEAPKGRVKLLDFGLARPANDSVQLTTCGAIVGTPAYMSPEQARGEPVDSRSDLFSLGVLLYRLASGEMPFKGDSTTAILTSLAVDTPVPIRQLRPEVSVEMELLIGELLAKDPADRIPSSEEVLARVRGIDQRNRSASPGPAASAEPPPAAMELPPQATAVAIDSHGVRLPRRRSARRVVLLASLVVIAAAALLIAGLGNRGSVSSSNPADPDRAAAEYVLSLGGVVLVRGVDSEITAAADLPAGRFELTGLALHHNQKVTDRELVCLKGCRHLTQLDLSGTPVGDPGLMHLAGSDKLAILDLDLTAVSDTGLANLENCTGLVHLGLRRTQVTDKGLACFARCTGLETLNLDNTAVADQGLKHLAGNKNLVELYLRGTQITDRGLAGFKDSRSLRKLSLGHTTVSDVGVSYFKECSGLTDLWLDGTRVGDTGLAYFNSCEDLTSLDVEGTNVTPGMIAVFAKAHPLCTIAHNGGVQRPSK
jgi:tRNA A-37 threonylcarbamoyl transferase component Bud32